MGADRTITNLLTVLSPDHVPIERCKILIDYLLAWCTMIAKLDHILQTTE